jgi:hypothetical protein
VNTRVVSINVDEVVVGDQVFVDSVFADVTGVTRDGETTIYWFVSRRLQGAIKLPHGSIVLAMARKGR